MKWKILLIVFAVAFLAIFVGNFVISKQISFSPSSLIRKLPFVKKTVSSVSEVPNYEVKLTKLDVINDYLNELNFWGEKAVELRETRQKVTVQRLVIHLTDKKYNFNNFTEKDLGYLRSTNEVFSNGTLDLYAGMSKSYYFPGEKFDAKKASDAFLSEILLATFALTNPKDKYIDTLNQKDMPLIIKNVTEKIKKTGPVFELK